MAGKILIITQAVDKNNPVLGFFHRWLEFFSSRFDQITVICLEKGSYSLPKNVRILSLGKDEGETRIAYLINFYKHIWQERSNYDAVFVHMNQEYVLLAGHLWRLMGKRVYLWRNHPYGNWLTKMAVIISNKVFYTSPQAYTARFKKSVRMPVGVDTSFFKPDPSIRRIENSYLFLGRIAPIKKTLEFVEWFNTQDSKFTATIAGEALPKDKLYEKEVRIRASNRIKFVGPVTQEGALRLYQTHETYVNKTPAGSFDKTIFEAAACGMTLMVDNPDVQSINIKDHNLIKLTQRLAEEIK